VVALPLGLTVASTTAELLVIIDADPVVAVGAVAAIAGAATANPSTNIARAMLLASFFILILSG
jgi:hypothetical protein